MSNEKYMFYLETDGGERIEWRNLPRRTALMLYNLTYKSRGGPNMKRFGWGEIKEVDVNV